MHRYKNASVQQQHNNARCVDAVNYPTSLPLSFETTLQKLGVYSNDDNDNNDDHVIKNNDHRPPKNGNDDGIVHHDARGVHHGSTSSVASVMIHPPITLSNKESLSQVL